MDCRYINLDGQTDRRRHIEDNFSQFSKPGWSLNRFSAIDTNHVDAHRIQGRITPAEKACFLSHKHLIESSLDTFGPVLVLEDDAIIGRRTCAAIEAEIQRLDESQWDIIFTDICIPLASAMMELVSLRRNFETTNKISVVNLKNTIFGGSSGYILNFRSKTKLLDLMNQERSLDLPYDLFLRRLIREGRLNGHVIFPFVTSLSELSETSGIRDVEANASDKMWNLFRRMIWIDRDLEGVRPAVAEIDSGYCDDESRMFGVLFAAMTSPAVKAK